MPDQTAMRFPPPSIENAIVEAPTGRAAEIDARIAGIDRQRQKLMDDWELLGLEREELVKERRALPRAEVRRAV